MQAKEGPLENREALEQLLFFQNRMEVAQIQVEAKGRVFWELNNPNGVGRIAAVLNGGWHENG